MERIGSKNQVSGFPIPKTLEMFGKPGPIMRATRRKNGHKLAARTFKRPTQ